MLYAPTEEEAEFFIENGYLVVKEAFSREQAAEFTKHLWIRLGLDPNDESTWNLERTHMPHHRFEPVADFAPRVSPRNCDYLLYISAWRKLEHNSLLTIG